MDGPVGIVLVSHSAHLAAGLRELVGEISRDADAVVTAGGTEDGGVGTSYELIRRAIEEADHGAGVVVLPDLGSSVLTARAVLDDDPREDVILVDAPFVEGAISAAVVASAGASLAEVVQAAEEARETRKF
jgi:PTS hybrid protein